MSECSIKSRKWSTEEDNLLISLIKEIGTRDWDKIAQSFPNKTRTQCLSRWNYYLKPTTESVSWSKSEDDIILDWVQKNGCNSWSGIKSLLPSKSRYQITYRYNSFLKPNLPKNSHSTHKIGQLISSPPIDQSLLPLKKREIKEKAKEQPWDQKTLMRILENMQNEVMGRIEGFKEKVSMEIKGLMSMSGMKVRDDWAIRNGIKQEK